MTEHIKHLMESTPLRTLSRGSSLLSTLSKEPVSSSFPLPHYVIHYIFCFLRKKELKTCNLVAKLWRTVALDARFAWLDVFTIDLEYKVAYYMAYTYGQTKRRATANEIENGVLMRFNHVEEDPGSPGVIKFCNKTPYLELKLQLWSRSIDRGRQLLENIQTALNHRELWRCELVKIGYSDVYALVFSVFIPQLEKLAYAGSEIPLARVLIEAAIIRSNTAITANALKLDLTSTRIPSKSVVPQKQPSGLSKTLYKYQLDAVNWMKSVEEDVDIGFLDALPIHPRAGVLLDLRTDSIFSTKNLNKYQNVVPRGAILGDEMGLGKTTEVISLIVANPGDPSCIGPSNFGTSAAPNTGFPTNATLVIVPSHLVKQWHEEVEKTTKGSLNVVAFTTVHDFHSCTYGDIIAADVVIVSHQMLCNKHYFNMGEKGEKKASPNDMFGRDARKARIDKVLNDIWASGSYTAIIAKKDPVFEHFKWRRIVVDEAHQVISNRFYQETFGHYDSNFWWYVSGTPFPSSDIQNLLPQFLRFPKTGTYACDNFVVLTGEQRPLQLIHKDIFLNNLIWRNTKASVKNEYEIPPVVEDLRLLDFTSVESLVYIDATSYCPDKIKEVIGGVTMCDAYDKLCQLTGPTPLSVVRTSFIGILKDRVKSLTAELKQLQARLLELTVEHKAAAKAHQECEKVVRNYEEKKRADPTVTGTKEFYASRKRVTKASGRVISLEAQVENQKIEIAKVTNTKEKNENLLRQFEEAVSSLYTGPDMSKAVCLSKFVIEADSSSETSVVDRLLWSNIVDMTLPQLKEELKKRGVKPNSKFKKADLQKALKDRVNQINEEGNEATNTCENNPKEKEKCSKKQNGKGKRKAAESSEENEEGRKKLRKEVAHTGPENGSNSTPKKKTVQDKLNQQNELKWMVDQVGTKLGNLMIYFKQLWDEDPSEKIIVFSQYPRVLEQVSLLLEEHNIEFSLVEGTTIKSNRKLSAFKAKESIQVLLLNINQFAAGTNIIESSHVILMEPIESSSGRALEAQAIARAHRQGQTSQVTVTRFVVRNTKEYEDYVSNYGMPVLPKENEEEVLVSDQSRSGRPKLQRSSSLTTSIGFDISTIINPPDEQSA